MGNTLTALGLFSKIFWLITDFYGEKRKKKFLFSFLPIKTAFGGEGKIENFSLSAKTRKEPIFCWKPPKKGKGKNGFLGHPIGSRSIIMTHVHNQWDRNLWAISIFVHSYWPDIHSYWFFLAKTKGVKYL